MSFDPLQLPSENSRFHWDLNSQSGSSLRGSRVHSLTLSYTSGSMKCDSWASLLDHTFASPCFGRKPKARVVTFGDAPPSSLKDSNASLKMKTTKEEKNGVRSLARNTLGVRGVR
jgi:hypothetical protein